MTSLRTLSSHAKTVAVVAIVSLPCIASAATIVGGSDLLSAADATQLESWLGEGPLTLTNIFDKATGDDSYTFHAAADGMGRTFSVMEVVVDDYDHPVLIGGYNPQSWSSINDYNLTPLDVDRTAFVFNLTQGVKFDQRKDADSTNYGLYQTVNHEGSGPTFGGGFDLYVGPSLSLGSSLLYSYGRDNDLTRDLAGWPNGGGHPWNVMQIEVFTISAVPEPETWALMLGGLGMLGIATRRCRRG